LIEGGEFDIGFLRMPIVGKIYTLVSLVSARIGIEHAVALAFTRMALDM
jgi:hypothetical protein